MNGRQNRQVGERRGREQAGDLLLNSHTDIHREPSTQKFLEEAAEIEISKLLLRPRKYFLGAIQYIGITNYSTLSM